LDEYWQNVLKDKVKAALQKLAVKSQRVAAADPDNAADLRRKRDALDNN
jgi:hypothetical protein